MSRFKEKDDLCFESYDDEVQKKNQKKRERRERARNKDRQREKFMNDWNTSGD